MPYTPPAQHSPASPTSLSPTYHFDQHSHGHRRHPPRSSSGSGNLPRSRSSSSAAARRRSSEDDTIINTVANKAREDHQMHEQRPVVDASLRQSPPPRTNNAMPAGAIMSPPDSGNNSDDDSAASKQKEDAEIKELEKAVRQSLQINRTGSPDLNRQFQFPPQPEAETEKVDDNKVSELTAAARKISHSRSSTDTAIVFIPAKDTDDSPANGSISDGSEEDFTKPPLIRKKSGELVKPAIRPKSRRTASSMPGTPTYGKKGVHFNDDIQQVRHFLQVDRPIAVSAGGSPVEAFEDEREFPFGKQAPSPTLSGFDIRLGNFPRESLERQSQPVRLERVTMSADQKSLVGQVVVANLAFHKTVVARFTFDFWKTTSEVLAEYCVEPLQKPPPGFDVFNFSVKLSDQTNIDKKTMFICMRYQTNGQEFWDNNSSMNYQVDFVKRQAATSSAPGLGARPIPRSRQNSSHRIRSKPSFDEDFSSHFDERPGIKLKQPTRAEEGQPRQPNRASQQFSNRYDFGASLTAALNSAQSTLGDRSRVKRTQQQSSPDSESRTPPTSSITRRHNPTPDAKGETPRTETLQANRTSLDSRAYQEFVSKFCFFGSGKPSASEPPKEAAPAGRKPKQPYSTGTDGEQDERPPVPSRAPQRNTAYHQANGQHSGFSSEQNGTASSPQLRARTGSPQLQPTYHPPVSYGSRSSSPSSLGYRFDQSIDTGLLSSGHSTPAPAIQT